MAYVNRFIQRKKRQREVVISANELKLSFLRMVKIFQKAEFSSEYAKLEKSTSTSTKPTSTTFKSFYTYQRFRRCDVQLNPSWGRLLNAPIPYDAKFPLLLSSKSEFVSLFLRNLHRTHYHAGVKVMVSLLRQQIWLINAREACTKIVRSCVHCFRYKPVLMSQIMGNLPADRVRIERPFLVCGVDFCGPFYVSLKVRGRPPIKTYVAVFVCFSSKAVHLELVVDLSTDSFLSVFKRFVGRRGLPEKVYSDNATNFVGACNVLKELSEAFHRSRDELSGYAAQRGVEWCLIPPRSPHFGGLWEAAVKSAKTRLLRGVGNAKLTTDELSTHLVEVEALLNSRPTASPGNDPNDGKALTP
ncbi:uncharacterized protein LOC122756484 [Drosophila santomea]|uniref:uncharacterized protein LOC122756484 n=1 Tax=Drosophila santomea TaxID=129105 RepID=UPI001CCD4132|nr:uncharacterized protein LOC122756484 [Drosophila santomea]